MAGGGAQQQSWTVDEVTAPLPMIDLSNAVKDIKADKPEDLKLQSMFVQLLAGGECDILLGQMYNVQCNFPQRSPLSP